MNLDKSEVIQRFCKLASKVGEVKFKHKIPHDCFVRRRVIIKITSSLMKRFWSLLKMQLRID